MEFRTLYVLLVWLYRASSAAEILTSRRLQQNETMTSAPVALTLTPTPSPTLSPTSLPTPSPTAAPDFTQINMLLESAQLILPETSVSPEADADGCGVLGAIDLQIELMVTDQVNLFLVGQEFDIPTDVFEFGRRERRALRSSSPVTYEEEKDTAKENPSTRELQDVCSDDGNSNESPAISFDSILEMLRFQLELNLDTEIDELLRGLKFDIPETTIELSNFLEDATNTEAATGFREVAVMESIQHALSLTFGEELSSFIEQFEIEIPDQQQQGVSLLSALLDLDVTNLVCRDFGLKQLEVDAVINGGDVTNIESLDVSFGASAKDITATCTGDVVFGFTLLRLKGSFEAQLRFEEFDLGFRFANGALSTTSCNTNLQVDDVNLSGVRILFFDVGDGFINAVFGFLEGFVLNILERFVNPRKSCSSLSSLLSHIFTIHQRFAIWSTKASMGSLEVLLPVSSLAVQQMVATLLPIPRVVSPSVKAAATGFRFKGALKSVLMYKDYP